MVPGADSSLLSGPLLTVFADVNSRNCARFPVSGSVCAVRRCGFRLIDITLTSLSSIRGVFAGVSRYA